MWRREQVKGKCNPKLLFLEEEGGKGRGGEHRIFKNVFGSSRRSNSINVNDV